jgi:imidazole glycerol-phosphate synthase subunit HisF
MKTRIIAKLDVKPPYVVKPVHFEGLRKIGKPVELAKKYYLQGADEVMYIDIVASLYQRKILYHEVETAANELLIPYGVGGGIRTLEECSKLFHIGADKILINTYAVQEDPSLINRTAEVFGSQAVVVNVEAKRHKYGWECYTDCGRISSEKSVLDWVYEAQERGAGEILLQSVDCDGRQRGFDLELASQVVDSVGVPVVVGSGAGCLEDILDLAKSVRPSGIALGSVLHYDLMTIADIKEHLRNNGIEVSQ